ncbi:MAG: 2-dehydropantoate 2-reductase [Bacillota bacterium]
MMKIAILGAGAMGLLYGGYLSEENEVFMLCRGQEKVDKINQEGLRIEESEGGEKIYRPVAVHAGTHDLPQLDVLILFVKAGATVEALEENKHLISENTILLTLQNGSGHENILKNYAREDQIAIGVTQDGSRYLDKNAVRHTGTFSTYFGLVNGGENETLSALEKTFNACGFKTFKSDKIKVFIWEKLMINASSSVLTGMLGMPQGYVYTNKSAWEMIQSLVKEMVEVAKADGVSLDYKTQLARVENLVTTAPHGVPSICIDIKEGRKTEVDSISGSVVRAGIRHGIPTPSHSMAVNMIHALEGKGESKWQV